MGGQLQGFRPSEGEGGHNHGRRQRHRPRGCHREAPDILISYLNEHDDAHETKRHRGCRSEGRPHARGHPGCHPLSQGHRQGGGRTRRHRPARQQRRPPGELQGHRRANL